MINSSSPEERAASYALDILEEHEEFERELAASESLRAELADFQSAVANLAYGVPLMPLPASLKGKLFDRIDSPRERLHQRIDTTPTQLLDLLKWQIADLQQVSKDLDNWEPFPMPEGSQRAIWHIDEINAQIAFFLRVPIPGTLPKHWHATGESILVLEGNFIDDDGTVYGVGDISVMAANTRHQPTTSLGCLILGISSMNDKILVGV
jgi:ChrR Cupin-like domain